MNERWLAIKDRIYKKHGLDKAVIDRDGFTCKICGLNCENDFEIDHKFPKCMGGKDEVDNLQMTCRKCNQLKSGFYGNAKFLLTEEDILKDTLI